MTTTSPARFGSLSRRLMLGLLTAQFAMPMLAGKGEAAGLDEIKKRGLTVATEDDFRPFEFVKDGKPTGFDNELVDDLRKYASAELLKLERCGHAPFKDQPEEVLSAIVSFVEKL